MTSYFGKNISVELFGSSHGPCVGAVCYGIKAGIVFSSDELLHAMERRAPGKNLTSPRKEEDLVIFDSGVDLIEGNYITNGKPIRLHIDNRNVRMADYQRMDYYRPSHGDYVYSLKYKGSSDNRPSGRMTAPLIPIGLICGKALNLDVCSHISEIGCFTDSSLPTELDKTLKQRLNESLIPTVNPEGKSIIADYIEKCRQEGDSCGASVETCIWGLPIGFGEPYFRGIDSVLSGMMFSIPGLRSFSLGEGKDFSAYKGSQSNDALVVKDGSIKTMSNHSGGVNAGLSNGMPLRFTTVFRPTPSISKAQRTVDFANNERLVSIEGRHDPCIALRAIPVIEACSFIALYDLSLDYGFDESLECYRSDISHIDNQIARLLLERYEITRKIGEIKKARGIAVTQKNREEEETSRVLNAFFDRATPQQESWVREAMNHLYQWGKMSQEEKD